MMNIPPIQGPIVPRTEGREFELEVSAREVIVNSIYNLMPLYIQAFSHMDGKALAEMVKMSSDKTLKNLLGAYGVLYANDFINAQDWQNGNFALKTPQELPLTSSYGPWVLLGALTTIGASYVASSHLQQVPMQQAPQTIEEEGLPTNNAQLRQDVYDAALGSGIMPNQFKDFITTSTIETPVAFKDDPTATIYDLETVNAMRERGITKNPHAPLLPLNFNKLVYLPEVKKQIDEIAKIEAKNEKIALEKQIDEEKNINLSED